ncbi:MAG: hypothetical protein V4671_02280 [Armatimonadota bacterium]
MRETISVRVVRLGEQEDGFGGAFQVEEEIEGSPFVCWLYRRSPSYSRLDKSQGAVTTDDVRILSFRDVLAARAVKPNDVAVLPACIHTGGEIERVTLQHKRPYRGSVQWDIESGATPSRSDSDTEPGDYD